MNRISLILAILLIPTLAHAGGLNYAPWQFDIDGGSHSLSSPLATPEEVPIINWCETCGQDLMERAPMGSDFTANPDLGGTWAGDPLTPPNWPRYNAWTESSCKETSDLPEGYTSGGYFNSNEQGVVSQIMGVKPLGYYFTSVWFKVSAGTAYLPVYSHEVGFLQTLGPTASSTWTRLRGVARKPDSTYDYRNPVYLWKFDGTRFDGRAYWAEDDAGMVKLWIDELSGGAGETVAACEVREGKNLLNRSRKIN
jgi:hypothetical protein